MKKRTSFIGRRVGFSEDRDIWWFSDEGDYVVVDEGHYDHTCRREEGGVLHKRGERFILVNEEYDRSDPANYRRNTIREWALQGSHENPCPAARGIVAQVLRVADAAR